MSLQNDAPEQQQQHIPAWKKLGLKLKYAQKNSDPITIINHHDIVIEKEKKRKRSAEAKDVSSSSMPDESVEDQTQKKKKQKKIKKTSEEKVLGSIPTGGNAGAPRSDTSQPVAENLTSSPNHQKTPSRAGSVRKSVSFTPDTKKTDGDSVKQLYQTWLKSHEAQDPSFDASAYDPDRQVNTPHTVSPQPGQTESSSSSTTTTTSIKKSKKAKKSTKSKITSQHPNGQGRPEETISPAVHQSILDYLSTYHTSHSQWKFSKKLQTHLLRRLLSPGFIPSSDHFVALEAYLSGLQGGHAKAKLRKAAREVQAVEEEPTTPNLDLNNDNESSLTPIPPRQIADLVLRIIGNEDPNDTNNNNDDNNDEENNSEMKEKEKEKEDDKKRQQQHQNSERDTRPPPKNTKIKFTNEESKKQQQPSTNGTTASSSRPQSQSQSQSQSQPQPYVKRIRKHKARAPSPSDDDDDDDDDESSISSSSSS